MLVKEKSTAESGHVISFFLPGQIATLKIICIEWALESTTLLLSYFNKNQSYFTKVILSPILYKFVTIESSQGNTICENPIIGQKVLTLSSVETL